MKTGLLIAEPDAELRRIYSRLSSVLGFHVETAADGLECWTKLRSLPPDVLVIDADIPWGGGDGVLACLREEYRGAGAPTVYVTGDDPPEALSARFEVPTGHCFQKPLQLTALFDSVCNSTRAGSSRRAPRRVAGHSFVLSKPHIFRLAAQVEASTDNEHRHVGPFPHGNEILKDAIFGRRPGAGGRDNWRLHCD